VSQVVGLLGGIGPASTCAYYAALVAEGRRRFGRAPEIVLYSLDFDRFTALEESDREGYVREIRRGLGALERAGATVLAMAANSPHAVWDDLAGAAGPPIVHIVEAVGRRARALGLERALLLGIPFTLRQSFYAETCVRFGLSIEVPDPRHHALLERVVFDELTLGVRSRRSRGALLRILEEHDVDALVLGCTELGDLIRQEHVPVPVLDSLRIHVDSILDTVASAA
jgi:aspartate racemase